MNQVILHINFFLIVMSEDHLKFKRDSYDCITLDEKSLPTEEAKFGHLLSGKGYRLSFLNLI